MGQPFPGTDRVRVLVAEHPSPSGEHVVEHRPRRRMLTLRQQRGRELVHGVSVSGWSSPSRRRDRVSTSSNIAHAAAY